MSLVASQGEWLLMLGEHGDLFAEKHHQKHCQGQGLHGNGTEKHTPFVMPGVWLALLMQNFCHVSNLDAESPTNTKESFKLEEVRRTLKGRGTDRVQLHSKSR